MEGRSTVDMVVKNLVVIFKRKFKSDLRQRKLEQIEGVKFIVHSSLILEANVIQLPDCCKLNFLDAAVWLTRMTNGPHPTSVSHLYCCGEASTPPINVLLNVVGILAGKVKF